MIKKTGKKKIAVLGLSFKPGTDDLRERPLAELTQLLIGKGDEVSAYDREGSLARLRGANKAYIEQTIPHISSLMKPTVHKALGGCELVVVGKRSPEYAEALGDLKEDRPVIDLASAIENPQGPKGSYDGICR